MGTSPTQWDNKPKVRVKAISRVMEEGKGEHHRDALGPPGGLDVMRNDSNDDLSAERPYVPKALRNSTPRR